MTGYDAWKTDSGYRDSPYRDMTPEEEKIAFLESRMGKLEAALNECAEYFDNRSDISNDHDEDGSPRPNKEMRMLQMIEEAL